MYKDCKFLIHLYFTSYKNNLKIVYQKIISKTTLMWTHTQRLHIFKNPKFDENNFNLKYTNLPRVGGVQVLENKNEFTF